MVLLRPQYARLRIGKIAGQEEQIQSPVPGELSKGGLVRDISVYITRKITELPPSPRNVKRVGSIYHRRSWIIGVRFHVPGLPICVDCDILPYMQWKQYHFHAPRTRKAPERTLSRGRYR
jgi:hypothetical protein